MANNIYILDQLVTGTATIVITDDGTGSDWLTVQGVYATQTDLRLEWDNDDALNATHAMGLYFFPDNTGHRLVIEGVIENIRGSNGLDFIQGNELANILYGDQAATGPGGADSLYGYEGNDRIYGGAGNDSLGGAEGDDLLHGDAGADSISGGAGSDTVVGGAGADVLAGGSDARDMVSYVGSGAGVRVDITYGSTTTGSGGHAAGDSIYGFADVTGSDHGDVIRDTVKTAIAFGYNANRFSGGAGNDRLDLGGGNDTGRGGTGNDQLNGEAGNDFLYGDAGADLIRGGQGADQLYGGTSADRFIFAAASESTPASTGRDTLRDFHRAEADKIDLRLIDARSGTTTNEAFTFIANAGFSGVKGQLQWLDSGANVLVRADINGDRVSDFSLLVLNVASLQATDFLL